jgi:hypothetical protein
MKWRVGFESGGVAGTVGICIAEGYHLRAEKRLGRLTDAGGNCAATRKSQVSPVTNAVCVM